VEDTKRQRLKARRRIDLERVAKNQGQVAWLLRQVARHAKGDL
jgi:hypothetical protein